MRKTFLISGMLVLSLIASIANAQTENSLSAVDASSDHGHRNRNGGNVYAMTNRAGQNTIVVLQRERHGILRKVQEIPTGGSGTGPGVVAPPDPLGAQEELLLGKDGRSLYAVNAGSDQISFLRRARDGLLAAVETIDSGGRYPVSLAQWDDRLYVLNAGGEANVAVFQIDRDGSLSPVPGSTRPLGINVPAAGSQIDVFNAPTQLGFTPDGDWLVVALKSNQPTGSFKVFAMSDDGDLADQFVTTDSIDPAPFGFFFDRRGYLYVTEAGANAVSSNSIREDGTVETVTASVANGQAATCWIAATRKFAYTANAGSNTISSYRIGNEGKLQLAQAVAADVGAGRAPTDLKVSEHRRYLDVLFPGTGSIGTYRIEGTGALTKVGEVSFTSPFSGAQGLVTD